MNVRRPVTAWLVSAVLVAAALAFVLRQREPSEIVSLTPPTPSLRPAPGIARVSAFPDSPRPVAAAVEPPPAEAPRKFERRFMFDCNGDQFFVRIGDGEARLLPPGSLTGYYIPLAPSGGSTWRGRYANEDIVFRSSGGVGAFELGAQRFDNCVATRDRAALAEAGTGVTVQAFGHSPAWNFEIVVGEGFVLTTERGARHVVPFREPIDNGGKITFRSVVGTQEMVAVIDRIQCLDVPSGETFAHAVTVVFDDEWYYGCGRFIRYRDDPAAIR